MARINRIAELRIRSSVGRDTLVTLAVLILGAAATVFSVYQATTRVADDRELQASILLADTVDDIQHRTASYLEVLYGLRGIFHAYEDVTRAEFSEYLEFDQIGTRYPGIRAVEFTRLVLSENLDEFERSTRADTSLTPEGFPTFFVHPLTDNKDAFIVDYIVPHEPNRQAFGFDLGSNPVRRSAIETARDTGEAVATSGIVLIQGEDNEIGFLMLVPVYDQHEQFLRSVTDRQASFIGVVNGVFVLDEVLADIIDPRRFVDLEVFDSGPTGQKPTAPELATLLYDSDDILDGAETEEVANDVRLATIQVGGRWWTIAVTPLVGSKDPYTSALPWLLLSGGTLLTLSLAGLVNSLARSRGRAVTLASQMTAELSETTRRMKEARDEAVKANSSKTEFLANMSHELRTPLTGVLGLGELLENRAVGPLNPKQSEYVNQIRKSGNHLLYLINDLLDLAKIESGGHDMRHEVVSTALLVADSVALVHELAVAKEVTLTTKVHERAPSISGDPLRLKQALVNLLSNAIRFTDAGGQVGIEVSVFAERLELIVWDTGTGIPADEHDNIFEPFAQGRSESTVTSLGTGLGLSVTRSIAEMHGGSINVQSEVGVGSRFTICLPVDGSMVKADTIVDPGPPPSQTTVGVGSGTGVVLIADDDPVIRTVLDQYLSDAGFTVHLAVDGVEAIEMAALIVPDIALIDIRMPRLDGLEAARRIRLAPDTKDIGIIIISANARHEDRILSLEAGGDEFLSKPVDFKRLTDAIATVIKARL